MKAVYEQFFYMKYYGGWSLFELYNLPLGLRKFYAEMLSNLKKKEAEEQEKAVSKAKSSIRR
jgi:hypothetical protein|tara:strand:+ start:308 stop:493 length:186 start_codon:yes stop_codon:yes gene_type:complete